MEKEEERMLYIVLCAVAFVLLTEKEIRDFSIVVLSIIMGGLIGFLVWFGLGAIIGNALPKQEIIEEEKLCALSDIQGIEGEGFLGSGTVKGSLTYYYITQTEQGKRIQKANVADAYICEGDYEPVIRTHTFTIKNRWWYLLAHDWLPTEDYVEFFVPEGSVNNSYLIDLE